MARIQMEDLLAFLKEKAPRDPQLWTEVIQLNWDYEEHLYPVINWILDQPECDTAFPIEVLELMNADVTFSWAAGNTDFLFHPKGLEAPEVKQQIDVIRKISKRSEEGSFVPATYRPDANPPGNLNMLQGVVLSLKKEGRDIPFPLPVKLLEKEVDKSLPKRATKAKALDFVLDVPDDWL